MYHHRTYDVKTMCYIVFISHSLHWRYIKTALQAYVINFSIEGVKMKFITFLKIKILFKNLPA